MADDIDENDLHAFLDGQLDDRQTRTVIAWLEANPAAQERLRAFAEHKLLVGAAIGDVSWTGTPAIAAKQTPASVRRRAITAWLMRVAAAAVLFLAGWTSNDVLRDGQIGDMPAYARDAVISHELFAEDRLRPVELPGNRRDEIVRWLSRKLGEPVQIPEMHPIGLNLVGARLQTAEGPVAQLVYEDAKGHRLTLSIAPDETDAPPDLSLSEIDGYVVGYWRGQRFAYALVGRSTPVQMAEIAVALGAHSD